VPMRASVAVLVATIFPTAEVSTPLSKDIPCVANPAAFAIPAEPPQ